MKSSAAKRKRRMRKGAAGTRPTAQPSSAPKPSPPPEIWTPPKEWRKRKLSEHLKLLHRRRSSGLTTYLGHLHNPPFYLQRPKASHPFWTRLDHRVRKTVRGEQVAVVCTKTGRVSVGEMLKVMGKRSRILVDGRKQLVRNRHLWRVRDDGPATIGFTYRDQILRIDPREAARAREAEDAAAEVVRLKEAAKEAFDRRLRDRAMRMAKPGEFWYVIEQAGYNTVMKRPTRGPVLGILPARSEAHAVRRAAKAFPWVAEQREKYKAWGSRQGHKFIESWPHELKDKLFVAEPIPNVGPWDGKKLTGTGLHRAPWTDSKYLNVKVLYPKRAKWIRRADKLYRAYLKREDRLWIADVRSRRGVVKRSKRNERKRS